MEKPSITQEHEIEILLDKAYEIRVNNLQRSTELARKALSLAKEISSNPLIARSLSHLSLFSMIMSENENSIKYAEEAIKIFEEIGDEKGVADAKYSIAGTMYKTDDFNLGLKNLKDCLFIYRKYDDFHNQARVQKSMGTIFEYFGDVKSAISSYEHSIEAGIKAGDPNLESNAYNPLSGIYLNEGEIDKALELIEKSVNLKKLTGDTRGLAFALYGRGKVLTKIKDFAAAEIDYKESIEIHKKMGEKLGLAMVYSKIGEMYFESGIDDKAKEYLYLGLDIAEKYSVILIKYKCYYLLHELYKRENNLQKSLSYLEKYINQKEEIFNTRTSKVIESYETINRMESLEKEAQIQKEKAEIVEKKNLELDSYFYRLSHDLKVPITTMQGLDFMAREEVDDKKALSFFDKYRDSLIKMNHVLDSLVNITKMNHRSDAKEKIDFDKLILDLINSYEYLPNFNKVKFELNIESDIEFVAEWALVNMIIQNLIENAIKYARLDQPKPGANIAISKINNQLIIVVSDNGLGMTKEVKNRAFKLFYQSSDQSEGTGLGLYILSKAVEKLNGKITLESELGVGSKFSISLPET